MNCKIHGLVAFLAITWLSAGCGGNALPPVEPNGAREALTTALEAWKKGGTKQSLFEGTPSIQFNDPKLESGFQLVSYKILPTNDWDGRMVKLTAELSMKDKSGEVVVENEIAYTIDIHERIVIGRSDWEIDN